MTEDIETSSHEPAEVGASSSPQASAGDGASPTPQEPAAGASSLQERATAMQQRAAAIVQERPEVGVGAAFAGGLILALILKRVAR